MTLQGNALIQSGGPTAVINQSLATALWAQVVIIQIKFKSSGEHTMACTVSFMKI